MKRFFWAFKTYVNYIVQYVHFSTRLNNFCLKRVCYSPFCYLPCGANHASRHLTGLLKNYCYRRTRRSRKYTTYTVGWSDLALLATFEIWHISVDQVYFLGKSATSAVRQSFHLKKLINLKNVYFFENTFLLLQRTIAKNKILYYNFFFMPPKWSKLFLIFASEN